MQRGDLAANAAQTQRRLARLRNNPWALFINDFGDRIPVLLRRKLYCGVLNYHNRVFVVSFWFLNGLHIDSLINILSYVNITVTPQRLFKCHQLYVWLGEQSPEGFERRRRYFSYNLYHGVVTNLNGDPRDIEHVPAGPNRRRGVIARDPDNGYYC